MQTNRSQIQCFAVKVRPRGELAVGRTLKHKGFDILLPSYVDRRRYSDRIKQVSCEIFPATPARGSGCPGSSMRGGYRL
jgi:hypothetical protein